jgi:hypothetical protein
MWSDPGFVRLFACSVTALGLIISSAEWLVPARKLGRSSLLAAGSWGDSPLERLWRPTGLQLVFVARIACSAWFLVSAAWSFHTRFGGIALFLAGFLSLPLRYREPVGVFDGMDGAERLMIAVALAGGGSFVFDTPLAVTAALMFVAGQGVIEYFLAGWTKLRAHASWTSGRAIQLAFSNAHYGHPYWAAIARRRPGLARMLSAAVILIETGAMFALILPPPWAESLLIVTFCFHAAAAFIMGLNTFVWAFAATYPAILHCRDLLRM